MKKFSKVSGVDVVSEPKQLNDKNEEYNDIRNMLMEMIDNSLRVTSYGSARHDILQTTKITGKEMLVDSLINVFKDKEVSAKVKSLEILKENVKDWKSIDDSIDNIMESSSCFSFLINNENTVRGLVQFMERTTEDSFEPSIALLLEKYTTSNLEYNIEVIHNMIAAGHYDNQLLDKMSEKFTQQFKSISPGNE